MSTIKSSDEHLTLNADGSNKSVKFQANGVEKASISSSGAFTSTTIDATKLTGTIPNFTSTGIDDNADATAITISSAENVGIGATSPSTSLHLKDNATGANTKLTVERSSLSYTGEYAASHCGSVTNNEFEIHTNNTLRVKIDSTGRVTMPLQPSFNVNGGPSKDGNNYVYNFGNVIHNIGSHYVNSTGRFTAPIAGRYLFTVGLWAQANANAFLSIDINSSGNYAGSHVHNTSASSGTLSVVLNLAANDYISLNCGYAIQGSTPRNFFSGQLLG